MSKGGARKKGRKTLGEIYGGSLCPLCRVDLGNALAYGVGISKLPDGEVYCRRCAQLIRGAVYV